VIAAARRPRLGIRPRQLEPAGRRTGRLGVRLRRAAAVAVVAAVVRVVVAQLEEPDEPDDQGADVDDTQPDHEDPPFEGHPRFSVRPRGAWSSAPDGAPRVPHHAQDHRGDREADERTARSAPSR